MKEISLALVALFGICSAQADETCVKAIYRMHDSLTSNRIVKITASFSAVLLAKDLGFDAMTKGYMDAYVASPERSEMAKTQMAAVISAQKNCQPVGAECMKQVIGFLNSISTPTNRYAKAVAISELVKQSDSGELFEASQRNLQAESDEYSSAISAALRPAVKACR